MNPQLVLPIGSFPPISYWAHALKAKHVLLDKHEYFIKQSYRSRYRIYSIHGEQVLSIPVDYTGSKTIADQVTLVDYDPWRKVHTKALESAYSVSPYFEFYIDELNPIINSQETSLLEFNLQGLHWINKILELDIGFSMTSKFQKEYPFTDMRPGKKNDFAPPSSFPVYNQVFMDKGNPFISNLSILDLLFNLGPEARVYLKGLVDLS
ncbi:MAG: hypothetical protein CL840_01775 [Crocinitomicaceae bacterium]|nr:hypothetical protein [Crocinitomicaceae bacterium]|tara:strand:- start:9776 stop:10399 length:624 start_codon:yes stop_codon:yes gene_type:complete